MPTRLLTRREIKDSKRIELDHEIRKGTEVRKFVTDGTKEMNEWKAKRETEQAEFVRQAEEEKSLILSRLGDMKLEVSSLESRKKEALKPLDSKRKELADLEASLESRETGLTGREDAVRKDTTVITEWRVALSDRSAGLDEREASVIRKESAAQAQSDFVSKLNVDFNLKSAEWRDSANVREANLTARDAELTAREKVIEAEKAWFADQRIILSDERRRLDSDRAALEDAIRRTNKTL